MKHDIELVMWDLDGTILNTKPGIIKAIKEALEVLKYKNLSEEQLETFIGPPFHSIFPYYFGGGEKELNEFVSTFRNIYKERTIFDAKPYDNIQNVMQQIKNQGKKQALCTYKIMDSAISLMEHFGLREYFDVIHGSTDSKQDFKSDMLINSAKECNIKDLKKTLLVGDTRYDYAAAIIAQSNFLAANYGYGSKKFKEADCGGTLIGHANTPYEILDYIK